MNYSSHIAGFFNIIKFIAEFDFVTNPMILNFNDNLSSERVDAIKENFMSNRTKHPVMFIVTPYDRKLSYHTRSTPIHLIVHHMKKLAKALYDNLSESIQLFKAPDIKVNIIFALKLCLTPFFIENFQMQCRYV